MFFIGGRWYFSCILDVSLLLYGSDVRASSRDGEGHIVRSDQMAMSAPSLVDPQRV